MAGTSGAALGERVGGDVESPHKKQRAFMMGAYFAATGLGNKVAGSIGENAAEVGDFWTFSGITIFCTIFGVLVILIIKPLKRLVHDAE